MTWTTSGALWLLLAVPLVWITLRVSRTNFNPRQRRLQAVVRSLGLIALVLALARPIVSMGSSRVSVVYLVDVSYSISSRALVEAAAKIDELTAAATPAHWRIVVFGTNAAVIDSTGALRQFAGTESPSDEPALVDRHGTDLEAALDAARAELAPGHLPRIVLFSDGRATAGDLRLAVARLAAEGVPVHVEPLSVRDLGDTWVASVDVPDRLSAGAMFTATVGIGSQRSAVGLVELRAGGRVLASQAVSVPAGGTSVALDAVIDQPGAQAIEAAVTVPGDPLAANDRLARAVWVGPRGKVLYVEGTPASGKYFAGALTQSGFDVSVQPASALPTRLEALDAFDLVVLSDVARAAIPDRAMTALSEWVEKLGGGLLVAGGEAVFGEGGYRKTEIERLAPVTFERRDEPEIALIVVLDKSWSMAGQQMELCKAAAAAAIDILADEQSVGVITFNDEFKWDVTLRNVGKNRDAIRKAIAAIEPGGHTLIYPAIEQAYLALRSAKARAKHVVLLSDGRSIPDDYEGLVKKMVGERMTVSAIAVGPAADTELLSNIATWGHGRSYVVADATEVPQIFVKEAKNVPTPSFDEKAITPVVKNQAFLEGVDLAHVPGLRGRTATVLKDTALEVLATSDGDPLLAFWPIGLGRTAVFASDVKDRWAADWVQWSSYGPFFVSVARALGRQRAPETAVEVALGPVRGAARELTVSIEARDASGHYRDLLRPVVRINRSGRPLEDVATRQVAPGRYEARLVADAAQSLAVEVLKTETTLDGGDPALTSRLVIPDPAEEYRFRPPDEALLKSVAAATRGAWTPTAASLAPTAGAERAARRPLWPALIVLALGVWLADLLLRRIRVLEAT